MADFRKWVVLLAVLVASVSVASAQPFSCVASAGVTPIIRAEGLAEMVGDTLMTCTGGTAGTVININVQIFVNTNVTSRIINSSNFTEALLLIDDPGAPTAPAGALGPTYGNNVFAGQLAGANSLVWLNIPVMQPGVAAPGAAATQRTIRLTNVRVNATTVPSSAIPGLALGTVSEFISVSGATAIPLTNSTVNLAAVSTGLVTAVSAGGAPATYQQCNGINTDLGGDPTSKAATNFFTLRYREGFASSFKTRGTTTQTIPAVLYNTESGLTLGSVVAAGGIITAANANAVGFADQGTRFFARFSNVPTGVRIFVTNNALTSSTIPAYAVSTDPTAGGSFLSAAAAAGMTALGGTINSQGIVEVPLVGGTGSMVWEITAAAPGAVEDALFGVAVYVPKNLTIASTPTPFATVNMGFAPISSVGTASSSAPIPRFIDNSSGINLFSISACVTNLLFPYLTNQGGFDTGIAIVNTSKDNAGNKLPFNTTPQAGICTLYYFGQMGNGGTLPTQVTPSIAAGGMAVFALSQGGPTADQPSAATFQGYMIAKCNFQFGHGFAFVSDVGVNRVAHGYLALVIPDRGRVPDPFTTAGTGSGEQLGY